MHQNIQHFLSRKLALEIILDDLKPDLIVLSEHKLNINEIKFITLNNYSIVSSYCRQTCGGGGVMILSRGTIQVKKVTIPKINELCSDKVFECCSVTYKINDTLFILVGIYRTPGVMYDRLFLERLDLTLHVLTEMYSNVVLAGDININVLNKATKPYEELCNILKQHNVHYTVNFPTRVTDECESAIDNILTNLPKELYSIEGIITELSDHDAQLLKINVKSKKHINKILTMSCRKFTRANIDAFNNSLSNETWSDLYNASVETKYDVFNSVLTYYFDLCFPLVKSRINRSNEKWINAELIREKEEIINLSNVVRVTKDKALKKTLKQKKKEFNCKINSSKRAFVENKIKTSNNVSKSTWRIINKEIKNSDSSNIDNIKLFFNGQEVVEPASVCEVFNNHFINVVDNQVLPNLLPTKPLSDYSNNTVCRKFSINFVSEEEVNSIISSFQDKFSAGYDGIPMHVIKQSKMYLLKPLAHIINSSIVSGIFPDKLKISKIVTVFKKGNKMDPANYRPLSILPALSKIYERVVYLQLINFLKNNHLFDKEQHGFRPGKSVVTAGIDFVECVVDAIDKGYSATGIFMDLSKAFDSVSHDILIETLKSIGIVDLSLNWFTSYLNGRQQYVEIKQINKQNQIFHARSSLQTVRYGVPQGSILGPILFLCYIKGLPSVLVRKESKLCLYADDANLIVKGKTLDEVQIAAQNELILINSFLNSKQLLLNLTKTNFLSFHTKQNRNKPNPSITINSQAISQLKETKFLGLHIDENLSWNSHVSNLEKKVSAGLFGLRIMSKFCSTEVLKTIYFAHIHSHISFGVVLYGATNNANLIKILRLQKKAIRTITKLNTQDSVKEHFAKLGIFTIYSLYIFEVIMLVRKNRNSLPRLGSTHEYKTRNREKFVTPNHTTEFYNKKPSFAGIKFTKYIPRDLLAIDNDKIFKKHFKKWLINKAFYSFEEFVDSVS